MSWLDEIKFNADGLIPAIAQDKQTGRILMMAWMNAEALQLTVKNQTAIYYSRSRQQLWHKGETSGHTQQVHDIRLDCDADVLILSVTQKGLACHTGRETCFYRQLDMTGETPTWQTVEPVLKDPKEIYSAEKNTTPIPNSAINATEILTALDNTLIERKNADADNSYVASLYQKGLNKILEKVGEEATESIISAKDYQTAIDLSENQENLTEKQADLIYEIADIWFHTLVTLAWFELNSSLVLQELARRFGLSGIEEKASRSQ